jgi:heme/copper-type cytochrome/quinol oxidase subunit 2
MGYGYPGYGQNGWQQQPANGMGVAAMVLGILSVCLFCLYGVVGIVLGVLALIFGILGRKRVRAGSATNSGQALAGIILGSIGIAIGTIVVGLLIWGVTKAMNDDDDVDDPYGDGFATSLVIGAGG